MPRIGPPAAFVRRTDHGGAGIGDLAPPRAYMSDGDVRMLPIKSNSRKEELPKEQREE
jgi:hypothetical protein